MMRFKGSNEKVCKMMTTLQKSMATGLTPSRESESVTSNAIEERNYFVLRLGSADIQSVGYVMTQWGTQSVQKDLSNCLAGQKVKAMSMAVVGGDDKMWEDYGNEGRT